MKLAGWKQMLVALACVLTGCVAGPTVSKAQVALPAGRDEPIAVIEDARVLDAGRERTVVFDVYAPRGEGPYPVVLFSHGLGASKSAAGPLGRFWAAEGYLVLAPTHLDSVTDLKLGNAPWTVEAWRERVRDLTLLLDRLEALAAEYPELAKGDLERVGAAGHSFGAYTSMLLGGATVYEDGQAYRFRDERLDAIALLSGQGTGSLGLTTASFATIDVPLVAFAGSRDYGRLGQSPAYRREPYRYAPAGAKYLVDMKGAHHLSYTGRLADFGEAVRSWRERLPEWNGPLASRIRKALEARRGKEREEKQEEDVSLGDTEVFAYVMEFTLLFWRGYLDGEGEARSALKAYAAQGAPGLNVSAK